MLLGVYFNIGINSYLIDAIIGLSVVYRRWTISAPFSAGSASSRYQGGHADLRLLPRLRAVSKIIDYISPDGLLPNLIAFNVGVEIGNCWPCPPF